MALDLINRTLNVNEHEWPRILLAWSINFLLRVGFVVGWTVTVAMFINKLGVQQLPYLFVMNALLIMLGSICYSSLLQRIKRPLLMVYTILFASLILLCSTLFVVQNQFAFFSLILIAQSILLTQLYILITLFTEDLFSPLESERTFPLIATSETMAGVIGGLTVGLLSGFLVSYKFIYLWILCIFLIIPVILTSQTYGQKLPLIKIQTKEQEKNDHEYPFLKKAREILKKIHHTKFLRGIVLIVVLQFMLLNMMEFQYTKAVEKAVEERENKLELRFEEYQPGTNLKVSLLNASLINEEERKNPIKEKTISHEQELTKNLGLLQVIFSAGTLLVQILLASRLIKSVGIVGTLMLHPLFTLLNLISMLLRFNFLTATIGRSSFEVTSKLFHTAYHASYYATSEKIRDHIKEVMEGLVKPIGSILGFIALLIIQKQIGLDMQNTAVQIAMIAIALLMISRIGGLQKEYTDLSHENLQDKKDLAARLNAIEILGQKGHQFDKEKLTHYLRSKHEEPLLKLKILGTLKHRRDPKTISDILICLNNGNEDIRQAAVEILGFFDQLERPKREFLFTRYRTIQKLKKLFRVETNIEIKAAILETLAKIDHGDLIPFLIQTLECGCNETKRACIKACSHFHDLSIAHYLKRYLINANEMLRAEAIVSLWQFKELGTRLKDVFTKMKSQKTQNAILGTLYIMGETQNKSDIPYILEKLKSKEEKIQYEAAKTLAKLNMRAGIPYLADIISRHDHALAESTRKFLGQLSDEIMEEVNQLVNRKVSTYINQLMSDSKANTLEDLDEATLKKLKNAYAIVEEHEEVLEIDEILKEKNTQFKKQITLLQDALAA